MSLLNSWTSFSSPQVIPKAMPGKHQCLTLQFKVSYFSMSIMLSSKDSFQYNLLSMITLLEYMIANNFCVSFLGWHTKMTTRSLN